MSTIAPNCPTGPLPRRAPLAARYGLILGLGLGLAGMACAEVENPDAATLPATSAAEWTRLAYDRVLAERISPPMASRVYANVGVALWESTWPAWHEGRSLVGQLDGLNSLPLAEGPVDPVVTAAHALAAFLPRLIPNAGQETRDQAEALCEKQSQARLDQGLDPRIFSRSQVFGHALGEALVAWCGNDGFMTERGQPYTPLSGPGTWKPTGGAKAETKPLEPNWGRMRPFVLAPDECPVEPPLSYDESEGSAFFEQAREVYETRRNLDAERSAIAQFWADNAGTTGTPPGHWMRLTAQLVEERRSSLAEAAQALAAAGLAVGDAFIVCWRDKYRYWFVRPETVIRTKLDPAWRPLLPTPQFPEHPSGHSTGSGAASTALEQLWGQMAFSDRTHVARGLGVREFGSLSAAAEEAALSRLYGGIHYRRGNETGLAQGRCVGRIQSARLLWRR